MASKLPWEATLFPGSTDGNTTLKETAFKDSDGFLMAAKRFEEASRELVVAAESGDMASIKKKVWHHCTNLRWLSQTIPQISDWI